jgi:hypothetical protein
MGKLLFCGWLAFGADATTTHIGLVAGQTRELILTQSPWTNDAILGGEAIAWTWGLRKLARTHPRAARLVGWSMVAARGIIVAHNVGELRK